MKNTTHVTKLFSFSAKLILFTPLYVTPYASSGLKTFVSHFIIRLNSIDKKATTINNNNNNETEHLSRSRLVNNIALGCLMSLKECTKYQKDFEGVFLSFNSKEGVGGKKWIIFC